MSGGVLRDDVAQAIEPDLPWDQRDEARNRPYIAVDHQLRFAEWQAETAIAVVCERLAADIEALRDEWQEQADSGIHSMNGTAWYANRADAANDVLALVRRGGA